MKESVSRFADIFVIRREDKATVIVEAFETSPIAEKALAPQGALQWDFPGVAVSLSLDQFKDQGFQESLAAFIEKASTEPLEEFSAKTRKAGVDIPESRDTVDPAIITQFLTTVLETNGAPISPPVLRKRVKDDVCWSNAELPWRRNPFWLTLRVSVQRLLYLRLGCDIGRRQYKFLMCHLMAQLLMDSVDVLSAENCNFLRSKLCRRLAKLEIEKENSSAGSYPTYVQLFAVVGPFCQKAIDLAASTFEAAWRTFKEDFRRKVPLLPIRADERDLHLTLPNSSSFLGEVFKNTKHPESQSVVVDLDVIGQRARDNIPKELADLTERYDSLAELEWNIESKERETPKTKNECEALCMDLARQIENYRKAVGTAYDGDSEQMSTFILNVFELWVHMDKCATVAFPLLKDYHPGFKPELLDVLLLSRLSFMERLQKIQIYLQNRCTQAKMDKSIFKGPFPGCFADRYLDLDVAENLRKLQREIEAASLSARNAKEAELDRINAEYKDLLEKLATSSCTERRHPDGTHDIRGCSHCFYNRQRGRLKIQVHEDFLPSESNGASKRAVVFELGIPQCFADYRNATWAIMNRFYIGIPSLSSEKLEMLLADYSQLKYRGNIGFQGFSLASNKKSWLGTHYKWRRSTPTIGKILLPLGLEFSYYDTERKLWAKNLPETSFAHHFALRLPKSLPFSKLYASLAFGANGRDRSSYEAIAKVGECPSQLTIHEYLAHQNLMNGKNQRWFSILGELGASNINFSLDDTMVLFQCLVMQAGPRSGHENLRAVHVVLRDITFCNRLIKQIDQHLETISVNWRETNYMEILLTLTIQLCALCPPESSSLAHCLLFKMRQVTLDWITGLRVEMRNAKEVVVVERAARYCFLSALLCRRTFISEAYSGVPMDGESFKSFVEATIAMQESLVVDLSKFSRTTQNKLVRDLKMTARMKPLLRASALSHASSLGAAIDTVWPGAKNTTRLYTGWEFSPNPNQWWVMSTIPATETSTRQVVHYHLLQGHLLVDGRALGKLPADIRDSEILKELFDNQRLVAFPSDMPGMNYALAIDKYGHRVHLGYRDKKLIVRAQTFDSVLELVPRNVFGNGTYADLPAPMIDNCVHWVHLQSGVLEIRPHPRIWQIGTWLINIKSRKGQRRHGTSELIDPHSSLFNTIARIFHNFEQPNMLMVTQSQSFGGKLSVELERMGLSFFVNKKGLLQCKQLSAEVDRNQDAGALYGLESMLVLRNASNRSQRSVITTMGDVKIRRHGMHVAVHMENDGNFSRYMIDTVVGRLQSPPEPRLLYHKALLHAYTSCFMPDSLTGRTGTEEALNWLQSGHCQPWCPLTPECVNMLMSLSSLTPRREYYPKEKKRQQTVHWNYDLTTTIQHDSYQQVVDSIIEKSQRLSLFQAGVTNPNKIVKSVGEAHLRERALWRRSIYERPNILSRGPDQPPDMIYISRDSRPIPDTDGSKRMAKVREILNLLKQRPNSINTTLDLASLLNNWPFIGGYTEESALYFIQECLTGNIALEWGRLINICRDCKIEGIYHLIFHLGLISFGKSVNMDVMRVIASFYILGDLKGLEYPQYSSFTKFKDGEKPTLNLIEDLIKPYWEPYRDTSSQKHKNSKRLVEEIRRVEQARKEHDQICLTESKRFATLLLDQWPCAKPSIDGFQSEYLDVIDAWEAVNSEWLRLYKNFQLSSHIKEVQTILERHYTPKTETKEVFVPDAQQILWSPYRFNHLIPRLEEDLVRKPGPRHNLNHGLESNKGLAKPRPTASWQTGTFQPRISSNSEIVEIEGIVGKFLNSDCSVRSNYGRDLQGSITALKNVKGGAEEKVSVDVNFANEMWKFNQEIERAHSVVHQHQARITQSMCRGDLRFAWLSQANLWPCIAPASILQQLRSTSPCVFGANMKDALTVYALSIVKLQRIIRMKDAFGKQDEAKLQQEHNNLGHVNWDPSIYSDWLLLEIESNIQIRADQATVAFEMISPTSGRNSVLQMNMGQGKTSVIMPMIASVLADGKALTRLLVPRALLSQAAQILQSRLGGLLGREITHVPFSRRTSTKTEIISQFRALHEGMLQQSGVILGVPEHILSFQLSGLQRLSDSKFYEAIRMVELQNWMQRNCRDILDECDFTLAVKTQLIYPSGSQLTVDGHPERWEISMTILSLAAQHLRDLAQDLPQSVDIVERAALAGFPVVYFLRTDAAEILVNKIVDDICFARTSMLPIHRLTDSERMAIKIFISHETVTRSDIEYVSKLLPDQPQVRKNVHLLRGLLAHGILVLCLKKRWNIQYGLHPDRDPMAVPFHAKGVPSDQAEWGHPDVAILFTCLAFYHEGLGKKQFRDSLQAVLKSDDPSIMYDRWAQESTTLPKSLQYWNIINVDDEGQIAELWRHLRLSMIVINHFLCNFVFPVHAKQFSIKLQASGWDAPLQNGSLGFLSHGTAGSSGLTTGFSGTNDNRRLLPLTIQQRDLWELSHTNAEVLTYLLQRRNRKYVMATSSDGARFSESDLIKYLVTNKIQILIDAGAFILEMDNETLIRTWLQEDRDVHAAVCFKSDKAWVYYRGGRTAPLLETPFADNLENCLVYLDEAHTRGTDLKFPAHAQGALTLGLNQTKDHTVQGR